MIKRRETRGKKKTTASPQRIKRARGQEKTLAKVRPK